MRRDEALLLDIILSARDACGFVEGMSWTAFRGSRLHVITQGVGFMVRRRVGMAWCNAGLRDRLKADSVPA